MTVSTIYRGVQGNSSAQFAIGDALTTAQNNDDSLNITKPERVTTVAALRLLDKTKISSAETNGYYAAGDGGHGHYWYDSADTSTADNGFTVIVGDDGARWKLKLSDVMVVQAGVVGDGTTNDTAALLIAHGVANANGVRVLYSGISTFAVSANAQIPIKTDVDFCNATIVILGGVNSPPSFSTFNVAYIISDDLCPVVTVTGAVSSANLVKGALNPTGGLFDGFGYADITCAELVPDRTKTTTAQYVQSFNVNRFGECSLPLSKDLSAHAAAITVNYRKTSAKALLLSNISLPEGAWNNQIFLDIYRSNVLISNFTTMFTGGTFDNICQLIRLTRVSNVIIDNFTSTGRPVTTTAGSYCLGVYGGADIFINKMTALTGWGAIGTDDVNGLYVSDSTLNRVDAHRSGHNIFVDRCNIHQEGVVYGWGGGVISVKNSTVYNCPVIAARDDYGGTFFGALVVQDVEVSATNTSTYYAVDLLTNPLGASTAVYAPECITVSGVTRTAKTSATGEIVPLAMKVSGTSVVYAPSFINIGDIRSRNAWRFGLRLDLYNMERSVISSNTTVVIDQVRSDSSASGSASVLTTGVLDFAGVVTPTLRPTVSFRVSNCDNLAINSRITTGLNISIESSSINAVQVDTVSATQPTVLINACRFSSPASGFTSAPIGGTTSGTGGFTSVKNSEISNSTFDFSLAAALIGNTTRSPGSSITWPAGVTATLAFTGWRKTAFFAS